MTPETLLNLMNRRRSVRRFKADPVPEDLLHNLIEAAGTAPSASNKQPWRFIIIQDHQTIQTASKTVEKECNRLENKLAPTFRENFKTYAGNFTLFANAPILVVPIFRPIPGLSQLLEPNSTSKEETQHLQSLEHQSALMSTSMAIQNLLLAAEANHLGACCLTGPLVAEKHLRDCFHIPQGWQTAALIALGFPDEQPEHPGRKPLKTIIKKLHGQE